MNLIFFVFLIIFNEYFSIKKSKKLIISLTTNEENIKSLHKVIYSILEQNNCQDLYKILLILSKKEINSKLKIFRKLIFLFNIHKIRIVILKNEINLQTRLIFAMREYPKNSILIISSNILFPDGWLEMLMKDNKKYPNDIITCSIQYYFGKNLNIKELDEGFKGKYFGKFNHISNMIFNFAIINSDLGGTLYPPGIFKNKNFFNDKLYLDISKESDEFWQSCFIIIEDKTLRQSSKIYDYTEYLINKKTLIEKRTIFEKIKQSFLHHFPTFKNNVELRQQKIIVSFTSYFERFDNLLGVVESIKNQIFLPKKIFLILYDKDFNKFNLNLTGIEIIKTNENIKPHKKYYYIMKKYRDYAIITLDDDIYYTPDTFKSLQESYINHPNIISGRRTHLIKYKKNFQIDIYNNWLLEQKNISNSDYNIFITTGAGAIYPPDILNIEESYMNLINETITTDDITLKYFEIKKGIESIWVPNNLILGMKTPKLTPLILNKTLYYYNILLNNMNDRNINKLDIDISNTIIKNCCIQYKKIKTGLIIYLFNINNVKVKKENKTLFNIDAYSYCPINNNLKFQILFNKSIANCFFNHSYSMVDINFKIYKTKKILNATCLIDGQIKNFDQYYFPKAKSNNSLYIKIYNKRNYVSLIFQNFYCKTSLKCNLIALSYKNRKKGYKININLYNKKYICILNYNVIYLNDNIPIISNFTCHKLFYNYNYKFHEYLIGGIEFFRIYKNKNLINDIPNQLIMTKIIIDQKVNFTHIIIKGKLHESLKIDLKDLKIFVTYPKLYLTCYLKSSSKFIQSNMNCYTKNKIKGEILIGNQIIYNTNYSQNLIILNKITLYQNYEILSFELSNYNIYIKNKIDFINIHKNNENNFIQNIYYYFFLLVSLKYCIIIKYYLN